MERIIVDKTAEESVTAGHLWIFSNQVRSKPAGLPDGSVVEVAGERGRLLGTGYYNGKSLIALRLLARERVEPDESFFARRIEEALKLRAGLYEGSFRAVNAESDFLPGLIIDKYEEQAVVQLVTLGMERQKEHIVAAVQKALAPSAIVLRNDSPGRAEEGLPAYTEVAYGEAKRGRRHKGRAASLPRRSAVRPEDGLLLRPAGEQAADEGLRRRPRCPRPFLLHGRVRALRAFLRRAPGDVRRCLRPGDRDVQGERAAQQPEGASFVKGDAFDYLKESTEAHDLIVLDPPSFIKSKKKIREGEKGYIDLHKKALRRLSDGGHLFTFSCSYHMKRPRFRDMVRIAAYGRADVYLIRELTQAADHPVLLTIPETEYLKGLIAMVRHR